MAKIKAPKSKRMSSKQRHKIERKKREHTRDLRKAAKALKKTGAAPTRSKKSRDMAKLALKISNAHPDKEQILRSVLHARENARVEKAEKKLKKQTSDEEAVAESPVLSTKRNVLLFPVKESNSFPIQFERSLNELVFPDGSSEKTMELPSAAYVVTLDSRFSVQCMPWTLIDAIVEQGREFAGKRKVLVLFVLTKCDLISAPALVSQLSLVAFALKKRYPTGLGENIVAAITLFSIYHDKFGKHLLRLLRQFQLSDGCSSKKMLSNLDNKVCAFVIGLPNTGRHSLRKALATPNTDSSVSVVPLRAAQLQLTKATESENSDGVRVKFAIPLAKSITFVSLPEDASIRAELKNVTGGDILFRSPAFIERTLDPEAVGMVLFDGVLDQVGLAQAFCQPFTPAAEESGKGRAAESFLRNLGRTVRQDKGFYVSPLFSSSAGSMGKLTSSNLTAHVGFTSRQQSSAATLLDASFSNATPSKLVRISSVITPSRGGRKSNPMAQKVDSRNALRLGARTFLREMSQGRNVPWAVMRAPGQEQLTPSQVAKATEIFDLSLCCGKKMGDGGAKKLVGMEHMTALLDHFASLLKDVMPFLPNGVVEINPDSIVPPQYALGESTNEDESNEGSDVISCGSENDSGDDEGANEDSDEDVEDTE